MTELSQKTEENINKIEGKIPRPPTLPKTSLLSRIGKAR